MKCPICGSDKIRRSARRGIKEGLLLRLARRAPYRCLSCERRFTERLDSRKFRRQGRFPGLAAYLGLRRGQRKKLALLLISLGLVLFLLLIVIAFTRYMSKVVPDTPGRPSRSSLDRPRGRFPATAVFHAAIPAGRGGSWRAVSG